MKKLIIISLAVLAGVCFGVALSTHLLITGALGKTYRAYIVQSGSMEPALKTGSIVFTQSAAEYSVGEIITFSAGNSLVTHRITEIKDGTFQTKGDANEDPDSFEATKDKIVGKAFLSVPYLGYFADFVRTPRGFVILVVIPASIIVYEELKAVLKEIKKLIFKKDGDDTTTQRAALLLPVIGIAFLLFSQTGSFYLDNESSNTNVLGVAESFGEEPVIESIPSPEATPTDLP